MTDSSLFTDEAWAATAEIRAAIDQHPFLGSLRSGSLPRTTFLEYLTQDSHYLIGYARALASCAAQAVEGDEIAFWASSARDAVVVERALHANFVPDAGATDPSPTCAAYLSFLFAVSGQGSYPVLAAALLPCFWIYQDVGRRLTAEVQVTGHPYAEWIATYGDPEFALATSRAKSIVDGLAEAGSVGLRRRMHAAFRDAARYEWMFFDAAWRGEAWPLFEPANGSATSTATRKDTSEADNHG